MPSVMTLEGQALRGNPVGDFIIRQGLVVGGLLSFGFSLAVGAAIGVPAVWAIQRFKSRDLSGSRRRRRRRRGR